MKPFHAVVIANYFVERGIAEGRPVEGVMKLIKLVYIAHGWHLGAYKKPLIEENIKAWKYGPVVRSVYDAFKEYGKRAIDKPARIGVSAEMKRVEELDESRTVQFLYKIWKCYRDFTGWQMSNITHKKGTPWQKKVEDEPPNDFEVVIPDGEIQDYYERRIQESGKSA